MNREGLREIEDSPASWGGITVERRIERVRALRHCIVERLEDIVEAVREDTGKVEDEALLTDVLPTLEQLRFYENTAARILRPSARKGSMLFPGGRAHVEYMPYGVALVIAPWNNPFQLCVVPAVTALLGGNTVIIKPSENSPAVAEELRHCFKAAGFDDSTARIVEGGPETARRLIAERPDIIFFTGGAEGGREVMKAAAEFLVPVVLELGGKDPMLVFADAELELAAPAAAYGAFAHDGQHCISVERLYVETPVYEELLAAVAIRAESLQRGRDISARLLPGVAERIRSQIAEAVDSGARLVTGLEEGLPKLPAVIADVRPEMKVMREESFGPVLPVMAFRDEAEAVRLANYADYGLNSSVWTADLKKAGRIASALKTGCVAINGVITNAGHPALPFGGVKRSGFGRYHGPEGLLSFVQPKGVYGRGSGARHEIHWFPYGADLTGICRELIQLRYGRKDALFRRMRRWLALQKERSKRMRKLAHGGRGADGPRQEGRES